ncbi:MAG: hypothetical protein ACYC6T_17610 [Thermoleophilia bacterium]
MPDFLSELWWDVEDFYWDVVWDVEGLFSGLSGAWLPVIGWLTIPLLVLSVWLLVRTVKRESRLRLRSLVLPLATTVLVPIMYVAMLGTDPPTLLSGALLVVGLAIGVLWANTTTLTLRGREVYGVRSVAYLFVWGLTFVLSQALALGTGTEVLRYGLSTLYFSMGISLGTNGNLLFRRSQVRSGKPDTPLGPAPGRSQTPEA